MRNFTLIFSLIFLVNNQILPQKNLADSLVLQLKYLEGKEKVDAFSDLADIYQYINTNTAIDYANQGIALATEINYQKGLASCYGSLGFCYINMDRAKARIYTENALSIRRNLNDKPGIATSLNVMGVIYYYEGNYLESIEYHLKGLMLREEVGDKVKIATSYNNISLVYIALENYETALEFLNKALKIRIETNNKTGVGVIKDNIGTIYRRLGNYDKAFTYLFEALKINEEIGNNKSIAGTHFSIAKNYEAINDFKNAIYHYKLALDIYNTLDEKHGISITHNGIASVYNIEGETDRAIFHALTALKNAELISSLYNISLASDILQSSYRKKGDYENAYKYLSMFKNTSDSLQITEKIKKLAKIEFENKVKKIEGEQAAKLDRQSNLITSLSITLFLTLVIVGLIVWGYFNKRKMNVKLNEFNSKLKELNSAKDRFFSIIAHDLRGPFHGMLSYSEYLSSDIDKLNKDEIKEYSAGLNELIQNQYKLLNDLLNWSKLQNENFRTIPETIYFKHELSEIIDSIKFSASVKDIGIINEVADDFIVFADRNMLRLVLRNLISNGIKFTGKKGFVKISSVKKEDYDEIFVTDNGMGISDEEQEKLFQMDIHHSTKGTAGETGTGIGLLLSKEIVEKHSGKIKVKSQPGKGTTFSFTLKRN